MENHYRLEATVKIRRRKSEVAIAKETISTEIERQIFEVKR